MAEVQPQAQMGFEEEIIEDADLEAILEEREALKARKATATKDFNEADEKAQGQTLALELPEGKVGRCGRFTIETVNRPARTVDSFETQAKTKMRIKPVKTEGAKSED